MEFTIELMLYVIASRNAAWRPRVFQELWIASSLSLLATTCYANKGLAIVKTKKYQFLEIIFKWRKN